MSGYAKLFSSIVHSTVWRAPNHVRLLWVTMLALANKHGVVEASVPGLADAARISLAECEAALLELQAPDPYSRTKDYDGCRLAATEGGFLILNYVAYRERKDEDQTREATRERVRRFREKARNTRNAAVTPGNAIPESNTNTRGITENDLSSPAGAGVSPVTTTKGRAGKGNGAEKWLTPFVDAWIAAYGGKPAIGKLLKPLAALRAEHGDAITVARWSNYLASTPAKYRPNAAHFAETFGQWTKASTTAGPGAPKPTPGERTIEAARRFIARGDGEGTVG